MDLKYDFCVMPEGLVESIQLKSGVRVNADGQFATDRGLENVDVNQMDVQEDTVLLDFVEDFTFDQHLNHPIEPRDKVYHYKKKAKQRIKHTASSINGEEHEHIYPPFDTFDRQTAKILQSIVSFNSCYTGEFGKIIGKGANSYVIHVWIRRKFYPPWYPGPKFNRLFPSWKSEYNVVKVYKLSEDLGKNERIFEKVKKEKQHLLLLRQAKCNVPEVIRSCQNVLVMSIVGTDCKTASSITTVPLELCQELYYTIIKHMEMWYKTLHLVHGQLSSRNILFWQNKVYYIGWSHSVKKEHSFALKKLMRDCIFVTKFFEARLVPVKSSEKLFKYITGLTEINESVLNMIQTRDLWKKHLTNPNRISNHTCDLRRSCRFK